MVCLGYRLPYPSIRLGFQSDKDRGLSRQPYSTDLSIAAHDLRGHVARECQSLVYSMRRRSFLEPNLGSRLNIRVC